MSSGNEARTPVRNPRHQKTEQRSDAADNQMSARSAYRLAEGGETANVVDAVFGTDKSATRAVIAGRNIVRQASGA